MVLFRWNNLLPQHLINKLHNLRFGCAMSAAGKTEGAKGSDNVQVAVRCRPLSSDEQKAGHSVVVKVDSERGEVMLSPPSTKSEKQRTFVFDSVFDFDSQQLDVYNETARPIVDSVLEGYNGTRSSCSLIASQARLSRGRVWPARLTASNVLCSPQY